MLTSTIASADPAVQAQPAAPAPAAHGAASADLPANTKSGLKLAGLVTFVANSCPAIKPNYDRFRAALGALGLSLKDLEKNDLKVIYMSYAARYGEDAKANCEHARLAFGAKGSTMPDLFALR